MVGALQAVQAGMGEPVMILAFVVIVIGGVGSLKGAFAASMLVGVVDTLGRSAAPGLLALILPTDAATGLGAALASILIYLLMALVLVLRPRGLFSALVLALLAAARRQQCWMTRIWSPSPVGPRS